MRLIGRLRLGQLALGREIIIAVQRQPALAHLQRIMFGVLGILADAGGEGHGNAVDIGLGNERGIARLDFSALIRSSQGLIGASPFASIAAVSR